MNVTSKMRASALCGPWYHFSWGELGARALALVLAVTVELFPCFYSQAKRGKGLLSGCKEGDRTFGPIIGSSVEKKAHPHLSGWTMSWCFGDTPQRAQPPGRGAQKVAGMWITNFLVPSLPQVVLSVKRQRESLTTSADS